MNASAVIATVAQLWRYPVKSMLGERVERSAVSEHGLTGDRRFALVDRETGKVASAKAPRLWRALLACSASVDGDAVRIATPGGGQVRSTDAWVDDVLTRCLGRAVRLAATPPQEAELDRSVPEQVLRGGAEAEVEATVSRLGAASPEGSFFDYAPLHLITSATLRQVAQLGGLEEVDARRFRPNLVLDPPDQGPESGFVEARWPERELLIGASLRLRVICHTPRCAVPTLEHGELGRAPAVLRTLTRHQRIPPLAGWSPEPCAGVYAHVLEPGHVEVGDPVRLLS